MNCLPVSISILYVKLFQYRLISGDEGGNIVNQIDRIWGTEKVFVLAYPQPLTGSEI